MSTPLNTLPLASSVGSTIGPIGSTGTGSGLAKPSAGGGGAEFGNTLKSLLDKVDDSSQTANDAVGKMIDGTGDVHEAMIALQHADVMLQMTVQIRNKLVSAYQDIMRMPV